MKKTDVTIFKRNEIVRGTDLYSLNAKRCFNAIYYIYQKNIEMFDGFEKKGVTHISLNFSTLRGLMCLKDDKNYIATINSAIIELQTTLIELNNFADPVTKEKYKVYSTKFINDAAIKNANTTTVKLEISTLFKKLIKANINFTKLDLTCYLNKFRTKNAMKLYEFLYSFRTYRYIDITHKHMCYLLNIDENSKYKYMSDMRTMLNRQIKEIAKKSDLKDIRLDESENLRKDKIFRIHINKRSKKTSTKKVKAIVEELAKMKSI